MIGFLPSQEQIQFNPLMGHLFPWTKKRIHQGHQVLNCLQDHVPFALPPSPKSRPTNDVEGQLHMFNLLKNFEDTPTPRVISLGITSEESNVKLFLKQVFMVFPEYRHLRRIHVCKVLKVCDAHVIFVTDPLVMMLDLIFKSFLLPSSSIQLRS